MTKPCSQDQACAVMMLYYLLQMHVNFIAINIALNQTKEHEMGVTCYFIICAHAASMLVSLLF